MRTKSVRMIICLACLMLVMAAGPANADFVLTGNDYMEVTTSHNSGFLYDSSTADVLSNGYILHTSLYNMATLNIFESEGLVFAEAFDSSNVNVSGGTSGIHAHDNSSVNISGGNISMNNCGSGSPGVQCAALWATEYTSVNISDGNIYNLFADNNSLINISGGNICNVIAWKNSNVNISGGNISSRYDYKKVNSGLDFNAVRIYDHSSVNISGGNIYTFWASEYSSVNISGGNIYGVTAHGNSNITGGNIFSCTVSGHSANISGGNIYSLAVRSGGYVNISGGSCFRIDTEYGNATFYGYDFRATGGAFLNNDRVTGIGTLTGKWFDGSSFMIDIITNAGYRIKLVSSPPEPYCGDKDYPYPSGDVNKDCTVDFLDFALVADSWLQCTSPECD